MRNIILVPVWNSFSVTLGGFNTPQPQLRFGLLNMKYFSISKFLQICRTLSAGCWKMYEANLTM